jgi:excisionase family DNA binding protein
MNDNEPVTTHHSRDEFLTARQLAAILQVSESTVRRLAREGRIPSLRITPHIIRFHLKAVRKALDGADHSRRNAAEAESDSTQLSFADLLKEESSTAL